ncbi:hypothetical protein OH76DRAFT_1367092 [Lentinus brumalis]|uniref:Uncharacterized protein n=1 Tax=Lentinus brumalis TaxID=2498619 RepID=A0A371CHU1_9APHY|nr:hypothetical protein OH76DRAFT_1367092 [Polyporus brumalis]
MAVGPPPAAAAERSSRPGKTSGSKDTKKSSSKKAAAGVPSSSKVVEAPPSKDAPLLRPPTPWIEQEDDFKIEFHPHASSTPKRYRFEDFKKEDEARPPPVVPRKPWLPFSSRIDFEFAEFCAEVGLNTSQLDSVLQLVQRIVADPKQLSFRSAADVRAAWENAKSHQPAFQKTVIEVPYKKGTLEFDVHCRSLWQWALALIRDPTLAHKINWHAVKQYKFTNGAWMRFWDEPNTADYWWDIETSLPEDGYAVAFILYADKTRLSSFGSQKGYPIVARLANIDAEIRNGDGYGGGQVVGFLPIVEDEDEEGKKGFTNLKRVVWHDSFWVLLEEFTKQYPLGHTTRCGDGVERTLYPVILILSADYEEQCMMSNIRGVNGLAPCPICLVRKDEQHAIHVPPAYPLRDWTQVKKIVESNLKAGEKEAILKPDGWRMIPNVFWKIPQCNVHRALCFDRLHTFHGGVWSDHLFDQWQEILNEAARDVTVLVNAQFDAVPRWVDLNHFSHVTAVNFTDGTKYQDISKVLVPTVYNAFPASEKRWMALLKAIRCYNIVDLFSGLVVQTEHTLERLKQALLKFSEAIQEYMEIHTGKQWDFPKMHLPEHMLRDIMDKGVTRNYNTKISEKLHVILKAIYLNRTNFKDTEAQLGNFDHILLVCKQIRYHLDLLDETMGVGPKARQKQSTDLVFNHVTLGADDAPLSLAAIEQAHAKDAEYADFRTRLTEYLIHLRAPGPRGKTLALKPTDKVSHLFITYTFGKLKDVFIVEVADKKYPIAFIDAYHVVSGPRTVVDEALGLCRLRKDRRRDHGTMFIHVDSIVRGALLVRDHAVSVHDDYFVIDIIDSDMFLRCSQYFPDWYS